MNTKYEKLLAEKKKVRHWLHWFVIFVTLGVWFFPYLLIVAFTMIHNNHVQAKMEGLLIAQGGAYPIDFNTPQSTLKDVQPLYVNQNSNGTLSTVMSASRVFNEPEIKQLRDEMKRVHGDALIDSLSDSQIVSLNRTR